FLARIFVSPFSFVKSQFKTEYNSVNSLQFHKQVLPGFDSVSVDERPESHCGHGIFGFYSDTLCKVILHAQHAVLCSLLMQNIL
ncbi:hypothetical protein, partial [uncultured Desulfovibrio sp.]|uniref:hypothetical protein n=1 Tax=uncultured Desulfovibrio sp. TaxID=167968 RepID=UPI00261A51CD